jgi:hypothetical protein
MPWNIIAIGQELQERKNPRKKDYFKNIVKRQALISKGTASNKFYIGGKMSSKEEHAIAFYTERSRAAKQDYILKGQKAGTFSALMPAYAYTSLCLDPLLRTGPACAKARASVFLYKQQRSETEKSNT